MFTVKIDDRQLQDFTKRSPKRARWALSEALKATGAHLRKLIVAHMKQGGGWPSLAESTVERKQKYGGRATKFRVHPLELFQHLVRFRFGRNRGNPRVRVGFFNTKSWFKSFYGAGAALIARLHEKGLSSPRYGRRPRREMIEPVWNRERSRIPGYLEKKFFKNFFSRKKSGLKF